MTSAPPRPTTREAGVPGAFEGETVTRRRFMTGGANAAALIAGGAIVLPVAGFAVGPIFHRAPATWLDVGRLGEFSHATYVPRVITVAADIGDAGKTTIFVRRRDPAVDTEPGDRFNHVIAITSRCAHVGCPVNYVDAAHSFVCPCHGGVYNFRGIRVGGPPPRPLDRFYTRVRAGRVEVGPRYSVNSRLQRFSPRDSGESLDGIGKYLYPPRFTTARAPKGA